MSTASIWTLGGLAANLVGVFLLFRFGIPYYIRSEGRIFAVYADIDEKSKREEERATAIGWIGLGLVVAGTIAQAIGTIIAG